MVNDISEKGLSVNHKVKIVNLPGGTSEKNCEGVPIHLVKLKILSLQLHKCTHF